MVTISYYQTRQQKKFTSSNLGLALERKTQLQTNYGRGFNGCSWFTIETPENQHLGFLQKPAL